MTEFRPGRFEILPLIIKNLIIINALVFFAQQVFEPRELFNFTAHFALYPIHSSAFRPWQVVTHLFMHGSIGHLFFNMFSLWMFGSVIENLWGPKRFLSFYLITGLGAAAVQLGWQYYSNADLLQQVAIFQQNPTANGFAALYNGYFEPLALYNDDTSPTTLIKHWKNTPGHDGEFAKAAITIANKYTDVMITYPTVGASGAVSGLLAAFGYLFPNSLIYLYFFVPIKAKWLVLGYFAYELFMGFSAPDSNIAHFAHVGGAVAGLLLVIFMNRRNRSQFY